ncbi:hypothetical protein Cyrtocomes_01227 [Candidatus Cyrtobacter comes]|uniref:Ribbon-helix-helix protein CopG domain-containing protein n=1 Tax=Candidatus Cyrtobacter comes TaxID=675776 RepID=A0ABU5L9P4_9RICK|nr:DUF6290 family protein [Candidatus Cyrtobacter comes]MDZ5762831.1 hypothetical protein [Candidatus Cyrtobacter comes]
MMISIRLSEEEKSVLEALAKKENVSLGQYIKNRAIGDRIYENSTPAISCNAPSQDVNYQELAKIILDSYINIKAIASKSLSKEDEQLAEKTYKEKIKRFLPNL